ncbi:hypothetical protein H8E50_03645, partial [bacterium]|nr:hypothetical protein [bacterium]
TDIDNTGQGRLLVTGHYDILDLSGEIVEEGTIGKAYVLPGLKRKFSTLLKTDLSAGNYTVRINYTSPNISEELNGQIAVMPQTASSF